ncbi:MAG TPA: hypothetical protein VLH35_04395 [Candidatus Acidoferrales bacterium]|nr:hypothetical protein [Candidatus Acidoferrales bacterium]
MNKSIILPAILVCIIITVSFTGIAVNYSLANENQALREKIDSQRLTIVFHVSEKGEDYKYARLPNATNTYNQLLILNNNTFEIALLPEYKGNLNWTEELSWIQTNFGGPQGIPIMLDVFGGGSENTPTPMLTTEEISQAMTVANIKSIRIAEVISWHIENNLSFPTNYLQNLLDFCKTNNLKIFWTEWKNDYPAKNVETFAAIKNYIVGYEDIVTVSFSTNSQELEPADAYLMLNQNFTQWGTSIQPWYWNTTRNQDLMTCPPSLLLEHSITAKALGAKIIQYEPYWYFFNYVGSPNDNLKIVLTNLRNPL